MVYKFWEAQRMQGWEIFPCLMTLSRENTIVELFITCVVGGKMQDCDISVPNRQNSRWSNKISGALSWNHVSTYTVNSVSNHSALWGFELLYQLLEPEHFLLCAMLWSILVQAWLLGKYVQYAFHCKASPGSKRGSKCCSLLALSTRLRMVLARLQSTAYPR